MAPLLGPWDTVGGTAVPWLSSAELSGAGRSQRQMGQRGKVKLMCDGKSRLTWGFLCGSERAKVETA